MVILESLACRPAAGDQRRLPFPRGRRGRRGDRHPARSPRIAAAIDRLLADPAQRQAMSAAAIALVRDRYTWQAVAAQTLQLYARFTSSPKM